MIRGLQRKVIVARLWLIACTFAGGQGAVLSVPILGGKATAWLVVGFLVCALVFAIGLTHVWEALNEDGDQ